MSADSPISAVIARRYNLIIERFGLITPTLAAWTCGVSPITAKQHPNMHFVGIALKPPEKSAHSVPATIIIIVISSIPASFPVDDKVLICLWQLFKRDIYVDVLARAGAE